MKLIPIKYGKVFLLCAVDSEDLPKLPKGSWKLSTKGYAHHRLGWLHRIILNPPADRLVDHINGNKLDNRKSNLRVCTNSENLKNRGKPRNNTTGFKGVCFDKSRNSYLATICSEGYTYNLGRFRESTEAARAYDLANIILFKEFSFTNFPRPEYSDSELDLMRKRIIELSNSRSTPTSSGNKYIYKSERKWVFSVRIEGRRYQSNGYDTLDECVRERDEFYAEWNGGIK